MKFLAAALLTLLLAATASAGSVRIFQPIYHFIIEGDTQTLSRLGEPQWVRLHTEICALPYKVTHVIHTGDLIESGYYVGYASARNQLLVADRAFDILDACGIPYSIPAGNHDGNWKTNNYSDFEAWVRQRPQTNLAGEGLFTVRQLTDRYSLVTLPFRYPSGDTEVLAYIDANPDTRFILNHHDAARKQPTLDWGYQQVEDLALARPNVVAIVSGHWRGLPRTGYGVKDGKLWIYSNFQDYETGFDWPAFSYWVTHLTIQGSRFCLHSENLVTQERDLFADEFCWEDAQ